MTGERTCKATLYVESPGILIPKSLKEKVMKREADVGAVCGHAFFGITDSKGVETVYGYHAATALPENAGATFKQSKPMLFGQKIQGAVLDDSKEPYDDKLVYNITQKQYDKIKEFAEKQKANPPKYDLFSNNCVIFAYKALKKADLKLPPQPLMHNPASAVLGIRILEKAQKIKHRLGNAAAKVLSNFPATRKIAKNILTGLKKTPGKLAYGVRTIANTLAGAAMKKISSGSMGR